MSGFCPTCGSGLGESDQFCPSCGAAVGVPPPPGSPARFGAPPGETRTSPKAILSLIFGLFLFFVPFSLAAVILGHLSLSEIRKSAGRLTGDGMAIAGLILGYMGIAAVPILLIVAAIAIPNLLRARMAANESSAVMSVRTITTAQITYIQTHQDTGYACSLTALSEAQLIDGVLARGERSGYRFEIRGCEAETPGGQSNKYQVVAYPLVENQTGVRAFCTDESAVIKEDARGSPQRCLESGHVL